MNNLEYERYCSLFYQGLRRFDHRAPLMSAYDYDVTVYALTSRLACPRVPRPGDVVWVRPLDQALWPWDRSTWKRHDVDAVGSLDGFELECVLDDGQVLTRAHYHQTWRFDEDHGPREVLS